MGQAEITNTVKDVVSGQTRFQITLDDALTLQVIGDSCDSALQELIRVHRDKWNKDPELFLVFAEEWFRNRKYQAQVYVRPELPFLVKAGFKFLLWAMRTSFKYRGLQLFDRKS